MVISADIFCSSIAIFLEFYWKFDNKGFYWYLYFGIPVVLGKSDISKILKKTPWWKRVVDISLMWTSHHKKTMLLLTESAVYTRKYLLWCHAVRTERSEVRAAWRHNKYFPYGPNSRLIRALLHTHTSKTTESQCFPLLLWTEVRPVHTPVRTQAYGPALSQSNFSILSLFCLVYNNYEYRARESREILNLFKPYCETGQPCPCKFELSTWCCNFRFEVSVSVWNFKWNY